jgi:hypothetical protein
MAAISFICTISSNQLQGLIPVVACPFLDSHHQPQRMAVSPVCWPLDTAHHQHTNQLKCFCKLPFLKISLPASLHGCWPCVLLAPGHCHPSPYSPTDSNAFASLQAPSSPRLIPARRRLISLSPFNSPPSASPAAKSSPCDVPVGRCSSSNSLHVDGLEAS